MANVMVNVAPRAGVDVGARGDDDTIQVHTDGAAEFNLAVALEQLGQYVGAPRGSLHGGSLHVGRSTRVVPRGVAPRGGSQVFSYTDVHSILMGFMAGFKGTAKLQASLPLQR